MNFDFCIIGGGIVGLATALEILALEPRASLVVLEKEAGPGTHQTGHNSGVIHSGLYYKPGSLKAKLCREGSMRMKEFCRDNGIAFETPGKLIVATTPLELSRMDGLSLNATANGIAFEMLDQDQLVRLEPNITGLGAIRVPEAGIVDYRKVCEAMARRIQEGGGSIRFGACVDRIEESDTGVSVFCGKDFVRASRLAVCGGLQADRLAAMADIAMDHQIVPFRGEYYQVAQAKRNIVRHMIYPVPDPSLPFLGIHLTPMIDGSLTVGPNAVLGFSREGYAKLSVDLRDMATYARFPGFWKTIATNLRPALSELGNSLSKRRYLAQCRKYCPSLEMSDLSPYRAGIRAQAVARDGTLVHDFLFKETPRSVHVINAPSPAATSSLPIGRMIAEKVIATG